MVGPCCLGVAEPQIAWGRSRRRPADRGSPRQAAASRAAQVAPRPTVATQPLTLRLAGAFCCSPSGRRRGVGLGLPSRSVYVYEEEGPVGVVGNASGPQGRRARPGRERFPRSCGNSPADRYRITYILPRRVSKGTVGISRPPRPSRQRGTPARGDGATHPPRRFPPGPAAPATSTGHRATTGPSRYAVPTPTLRTRPQPPDPPTICLTFVPDSVNICLIK